MQKVSNRIQFGKNKTGFVQRLLPAGHQGSKSHMWSDSPGWSQRTSGADRSPTPPAQNRRGRRSEPACRHVTTWSHSPAWTQQIKHLTCGQEHERELYEGLDLTWAPRSLTSSTDQRPSYWIHTKIPPSVSQVASFWKGSFHLTNTTYKNNTVYIKWSTDTSVWNRRWSACKQSVTRQAQVRTRGSILRSDQRSAPSHSDALLDQAS